MAYVRRYGKKEAKRMGVKFTETHRVLFSLDPEVVDTIAQLADAMQTSRSLVVEQAVRAFAAMTKIRKVKK